VSVDKSSLHLGQAVRELRLRARKSQMQLAEDTDLSLTYISEIERGKRSVSLDTLVRLARAFGLTGAELLRRAGI